MGTEQYHEPPEELSAQTRTFVRMCTNLTEEAEAIGWYEQRISLETDETARAVMLNSLGEEYKHFCMELEWLFRNKPAWREVAKGILFSDGDIVEQGEAAEEAAPDPDDSNVGPGASADSLTIGTLKGLDS